MPEAVGLDIQAGETASSTSYKARLISHHIRIKLGEREDGSVPLMVAMQGPQGCGERCQPHRQHKLAIELSWIRKDDPLYFYQESAGERVRTCGDLVSRW